MDVLVRLHGSYRVLVFPDQGRSRASLPVNALLWRMRPSMTRWFHVAFIAAAFGGGLLGCSEPQITQTSDPWREWRREILTAISKCHGPLQEICIAAALRTYHHPPGDGTGIRPLSDLAADLRAGSILIENDSLRTTLHTWYGIDDRFLGTGFSQPAGSEEYWTARVPEFLVPNYPDNQTGLWCWKLRPGASLGRTVGDLLHEMQPEYSKAPNASKTFAADLAEIDRRIATHQEHLPPVVRFAYLTESEYSGCLGRKERRRVFVSDLGSVLQMTVEQAGRYSGYTFSEASDGKDKRVFMMVFLPAHETELAPSTWPSILDRAGEEAVCR
jgi:hypothetical protein